jgi:putative glycosyltransferase (TIGR04372 family)
LPILIAKIKKSKTYIVYAEGGFGHGVTGPHIAQFYFDDNADVLILADSHRHNPELAKRWNNINVTLFIKSLYPQGPKKHRVLYEISKFLVCMILRRRSKDFYMYEDDYIVYGESKLYGKGLYSTLYREAKKYEEFGEYSSIVNLYKDQEAQRYWGFSAYHFLRSRWLTQNKKRAIIEPVTKPVLKSKKFEYKEIFTLYLRYKGDDLRVGGDAESWTPIIEYLVKLNYNVLLVGDRDKSFFGLSRTTLDSVYDHADYKCDRDYYNVWAVMSCDYFLGECGGGAWLAPLVGKPSAVLNGFQFAWLGYFNSTVVFKTIITPEGRRLRSSEAIREHFYSLTLPSGYRLESNSSQLIMNAIAALLKIPINSSIPNGPSANIAYERYDFPRGSVPYYSGARLLGDSAPHL